MRTQSAWSYGEALGQERRSKLAAAPAFDGIVERVFRSMEILCAHCEVCRDAPDFARAAYCIRVDLDTFDLFFNAQTGYRGAYFMSPYDGLSANAKVIAQLAPVLLAWTERHKLGDLSFHRESLHTPSAKVWLAEVNATLCPACAGEWSHPQTVMAEILNDRWELHSDVRGRMAPRHTKLRVVGAFLNETYDEFVPWRKRFRAEDLHRSGWA